MVKVYNNSSEVDQLIYTLEVRNAFVLGKKLIIKEFYDEKLIKELSSISKIIRSIAYKLRKDKF